MSNQTAFGGMLQHLVELTSIVLRPESLDAEIERRCKRAWEEALCPECEETTVKTREGSPRVWWEDTTASTSTGPTDDNSDIYHPAEEFE